MGRGSFVPYVDLPFVDLVRIKEKVLISACVSSQDCLGSQGCIYCIVDGRLVFLPFFEYNMSSALLRSGSNLMTARPIRLER